MRLYLLRHGETIENSHGIFTGQLDGRLTEEGRTHAQHIGELIQIAGPSVIYSSDLGRALETARIAMDFSGCKWPFYPMADLREVHFGDFQGKNVEQIRALCAGAGLDALADLKEYDARYMNDSKLRSALVGEFSLEKLLLGIKPRMDRMIMEFQAAAEKKPEGLLIVISHSSFIAHIVECVSYSDAPCGKRIRLREEGGIYPQRHDEATILQFDRQGCIVNVSPNVPLQSLLLLHDEHRANSGNRHV